MFLTQIKVAVFSNPGILQLSNELSIIIIFYGKTRNNPSATCEIKKFTKDKKTTCNQVRSNRSKVKEGNFQEEIKTAEKWFLLCYTPAYDYDKHTCS